MNEILYFVGIAFLCSGAFFVFTGALGLFRMPEAITRIHAAGVAEVFGACLMLMGVGFLSLSWAVAAKLFLLAVFLIITNPTACHALLQAAFEDPAVKKRWQRKGKEE